MLRIVTHIERTLLVHDCVIVPKFGGFVLQTIPAKYQAESHSFNPSRKEIVFNTTLQHNDGLLSESYMQMYGVDYRKAVLMLEEDVKSLKETLQQHKSLSFGNIGSFSLGEEGQTVFFPADTALFNLTSYGLSSFSFPTLESYLAEKRLLEVGQKHKKDTLYIPVSCKWMRVVAASAAAVALFFLVSTPVKDVNQSAYTASFVPAEIVSYKAPELNLSSSTIADADKKEADAALVASPRQSSVAKEVKTKPAASVEPKVKEVSKPVAVAGPKKMYHIVIASFPSESQANEYIASVQSECKNVSKVVRDGKYRIYADKYDNREQAENYMADLRKNDKFRDAWLFISR